MYKSDWFNEKNETEWEEKDKRNNTWDKCKSHFITCKWYHAAKGTKLKDTNRIDAEANNHWEAMLEQTQKEQAEAAEQPQQLMTHNTVLTELI